MAKFCNKCGKELVDEKCPNCDNEEKIIEEVKIEKNEENNSAKEVKAEKKEENNSVKEVNAEKQEEKNSTEEVSEIGKKVAEYLKIFFNTAKGMFKNPEKTLNENSKANNWLMSIIIIVINSVIFGFTINYMLTEILPSTFLSMLSTTVNSIASYFGKTITSIADISQAAGVGFAINSALIVIIVWVMHEILFRKKLNIMEVVSIVGKCQSLFTIELIITIIVSLFSVNFALILLPIFVISCLINIHYGIIGISKVSENQTIYLATLGNLFPIISITTISVVMISLQILTSTIRSGF